LWATGMLYSSDMSKIEDGLNGPIPRSPK